MSKLILVAGFAALIVVILVFGPFATIWAANTLFPVLAIPYTWQTWLSVILLGAFFRANVSVKK
jgi:hypothetical protein